MWSEEEQVQELEGIICELEDEFAEKERLSYEQEWCTPIPTSIKVSTVQDFYKAFHDIDTLPILTCMFCYRNPIEKREGSPFQCVRCFPIGETIRGYADCVRHLGRDGLSLAAQLHDRLGCEHIYPDELKDLTPIEEKLIALNSCYGFITKYSIPEGPRQGVTYTRHVKGHITVFPNNVQELVANVLPHPLLTVMDEIHVSWHGPEKPAPSDLSVLLSVRRRVVEKALVWLKRHNPLYRHIEIDGAKLDSWETPSHGVPSQVYERLKRDEPSAQEKARTGQLVPSTERGLEEDESVDIREVLATLGQGHDVEVGQDVVGGLGPSDGDDGNGDRVLDNAAAPLHENSSSGMFALDRGPDIADREKLRYVRDALGQQDASNKRRGRTAEVRRGNTSEPYIVVSRGEDFADSLDARFFAKTFPTLFPVGRGGPRQADESIEDVTGAMDVGVEAGVRVRGLIRSRNMSLEAWAKLVLQRHGGRFASHHIFAFLVFNVGVRSRNRRVSMVSVTRKNFAEVERIVRSLNPERLEAAKAELEASRKTSDEAVNQLLRSLSLYGFRQPMSRESRLNMRRKIQSLIIRDGIPAIWFTLNPNDITNPIKLRLAAYRTRDPEEAEAFLTSLDLAYKRARLAISDPLSSAIFFHREISLFFEHYVKTGKDSVFGRINRYFGAVETNERGALHVHGLLWLQGNMELSSILQDHNREDQVAYQERVAQYVDSVFTEDLDHEAFCAVRAERSVTSDISPLLENREQFGAAFDEEANFCAGATQIHTHSPTCRLVERTAFTDSGVLQIRRSHSMVNRWNQAMAVGLRHNHDISFIATQCKTMALVFYVTNYATKVEDPVWKRVAAAAELFPPQDNAMAERQVDTTGGPATNNGVENRTRQFLMRVANRIFTERALSQVEIIAHLLGYPTEFSSNDAWTFLNVSSLYWHIFRRWRHLRCESGIDTLDESVEETVLLHEAGERISLVQAYPAAVQHLAIFVPWESFLFETSGDINAIWENRKQALPRRMAFVADNIQLLHRSAEDAKRDAKQWAAMSGETDPPVDTVELEDRDDDGDEGPRTTYRSDSLGNAVRLIDVLRNAMGANQITAGSKEISRTVEQMGRFQQTALGSMDELRATTILEQGPRTPGTQEGWSPGAAVVRVPAQEMLKSIKAQQKSASRERERRTQGIQGPVENDGAGDRGGGAGPSMGIQLGPSTSFSATGRQLAEQTFTLNRKQNRIRRDEHGVPQLCQFIGGEGGTGKSRTIGAIAELFASKGISHRLLVTATSGTAAANINGITIHSACGFSKATGLWGDRSTDLERFASSSSASRRIDGRSRAEWQEKDLLIVDEVSMLGARTLYVVNEQLCRLRGCADAFGGIPIVVFCGDFHQFRPVQERSILLPSQAVAWTEDKSFRAEQRYQHDKAHALWTKFTTVVMLDEQRLLKRIREGVQERSDVDFLNRMCYREGRRIPWESGITVVTPLNRNRWNLNVEAILSFQRQRQGQLRIFMSEHKWKDGQPTEEEALMMFRYGDDSAVPVPAIFMFVPGMPIVVNHNTHQGLKLVNGASYAALDVVLDEAYPGHRVDADTILHFGPPAGILLASETARDFRFVGMPAGTVLLTPISTKIECQRKRPWQKHHVSRRGLPCTAAFACTDYKVQGKTLNPVALELRGTRVTNIDGKAVASQCDPYSLYVQLSRCPSLDGIMLLSKARERDFREREIHTPVKPLGEAHVGNYLG
ncbi:hypothetical protein P152DRAFT_469269 [Eremomyces bilateralis CBS 781.70]|uniref:ATP-dependent DNA helicase n=1 Tax=Eremomyces bilateralis CBS 781.70 TaxID=1392243 RepID=A0A6G1FQD1_9PEZI|nr:uncharacterized protein P152DRAFT_469269 [Eremomyces bilateralis CBS 781.70]KAF1807901.1 hypothetical protein P152DRAFT_469269 [Eremomyces bilateralis CBS 781.70]